MKKTLCNIKTILAAVVVVIIALCFGIIAFGCESDEVWYVYDLRIAKEFGCEKILLHTGGKHYGEVSSVYLYDTYGNKSIVPYESAFEIQRGGSYVLGLDKHGRELFIAIPDKESTKRDSKKYSPRLIQWPFEYSFTEIASFAAEHGYKYADGIDVGEYEKQIWDFYSGSFGFFNHNNINASGNITEGFTKYFDDAGKKYYELDVKFVFRYSVESSETGQADTYYVTQESGKLVLYEKIETRLEDNTVLERIVEVATVERADIEDAARIARTDFGCEKILWADYARVQNNVVQNDILPYGGSYIIGEDKDGNEVYVVVPHYITNKYKPSTFEWKFDYTFSQIVGVCAKYGYKYVEGVDVMIDKYVHLGALPYIDLIDSDDDVKSELEDYGDADELYEKLDVKLVFQLYTGGGKFDRLTLLLTQQGGSLVVYKTVNGDFNSTVTTVYNKEDIQ
ncbi:MAG: hypothetical protein K2K13_03470 [Clostridiales bacterium]|nr:hypothetical protein [Clostridiales bacterium]